MGDGMMFQYRISIGDAQGVILDVYPQEQWERIAPIVVERGGRAILERRLVTTVDILPMLTCAVGYVRAGSVVVCPWEIFAEVA